MVSAGRAGATAGGFIARRVARLFRDAEGRLRDDAGRFVKDPWRHERAKLPPARDLIRNGREWKGTGKGRAKNNLPVTGGPPGGCLYKRDPVTGKVTSYSVYDSGGNIIKRVDMVGREHGSVPTPHTVYYYPDRNPRNGSIHPRADKDAYPATPGEIP